MKNRLQSLRLGTVLLLAFSSLLATACRKRSPRTSELPPPPPIEISKKGRDEEKSRLLDLDLAVSQWYVIQGGATDVIQPFVDFDLMEVSKKHKALEILEERRKIIDSNPKGRVVDPGEEADLPSSLERWWEYQEDAAKVLRDVFSDTPPKSEGPALFDEQEALLKRIKSERDLLWKQLDLK